MISTHSVAEIFKAQKIATVAIIDDAFNPAGELSPGEAHSLYEQFAAEPEIGDAFAALGLPLEGGEHVTPEVVKRLRAATGLQPGAGAAVALVTAAAKTRKARLDELQRSLRKLGVKVRAIAATRAKAPRKPLIGDDVNIVLLDYDLAEGGPVGTLSKQIVADIYRQFKDSERAPLVILMSSSPLEEKDITDFQSGTKVLSGMFYFVPKEALFDEERRNYHLAAFARSLETGQVLQNFVTKVEGALNTVRERVFADVRSLSISDFTYLKMLRLHEDGQPLGEYLMWLMSAHLLNYLATDPALTGAKDKVEALQFEFLPPTQAQPSKNLAMLYSSAVMREMAALPADPEESNQSLQFGDLFKAKQGNKVWLCITAPCDLSFSPTRPIRSKRSILFIPGQLQPIDKELNAAQRRMPRTELLWLDDSVYRILWDTKEVDRAPWGKILQWQKDKNLTRIARLHTPFALEIQRAFAADLTRIGMPVPPPLYSPQFVRLTCLDQHGVEIELTPEDSRQALSVGGDRGVRLIMGERFMSGLPDMLRKAREVLDLRKAAAEARQGDDGPGPVAEAQAAIEKVEAIRGDASLLGGIRGPLTVPEAGSPVLIADEAILLCQEADLKLARSWTPLRLQLVAPPEADDAADTAEAA